MHSPLRFAAACALFLVSLVAGFSANPSPYPPGSYSKANPLFPLRNVDTPPVATHQVPPAYPEELKALKLHVTVVVEFVISKTGDVEFPVILNSTDKRFEGVCLDAVKSWKFKPALKKGGPVNCRVAQTLAFD